MVDRTSISLNEVPVETAVLKLKSVSVSAEVDVVAIVPCTLMEPDLMFVIRTNFDFYYWLAVLSEISLIKSDLNPLILLGNWFKSIFNKTLN